MHVPEISERFRLILEAYLRGCPAHRRKLTLQIQALDAILHVATKIKVRIYMLCHIVICIAVFTSIPFTGCSDQDRRRAYRSAQQCFEGDQVAS